MMDKTIYRFLGFLDKIIEKIDNFFSNKKRKSK